MNAGGPRGDRLIAAGVVALGAVVLAGATNVAFGVGYDRVGPRAFPYVVGGGLIVLGAMLAFTVLRQRARPERSTLTSAEHIEPPAAVPVALEPRPLIILGLGLAAFVLLIEPAGFIVAAAVQFVLTARAFKSATPVRDLLLGLVLAALVYLAFTSGLGGALPPGFLATAHS